MNENEKFILDKIKHNPFVSQQELAEMLNLSRSAVAGMIAGLTKQGAILGRAYILPEKKRVVCIGGANIDRKALIQGEVEMATSNPVQVCDSYGGVARNVAANLVQVGLTTSLLSVVGEDPEGQALWKDCQKIGMDIGLCRLLPQQRTGTYTAVINQTGDMILALADMEIYKEMTVPLLESTWSHVKNAPYVIVDTNLPPETLHWLVEQGNRAPCRLCIVPVSSPKVVGLPADLSGVYLLIGNQEEISRISGVTIQSATDNYIACQTLLKRGVKRVVMTLGAEGVIYYGSRQEVGYLPAQKVQVRDVTGAGDAFAAGVVAGLCKHVSLKAACQIGMNFAKMTPSAPSVMTTRLTPRWYQEQGEERE